MEYVPTFRKGQWAQVTVKFEFMFGHVTFPVPSFSMNL